MRKVRSIDKGKWDQRDGLEGSRWWALMLLRAAKCLPVKPLSHRSSCFLLSALFSVALCHTVILLLRGIPHIQLTYQGITLWYAWTEQELSWLTAWEWAEKGWEDGKESLDRNSHWQPGIPSLMKLPMVRHVVPDRSITNSRGYYKQQTETQASELPFWWCYLLLGMIIPSAWFADATSWDHAGLKDSWQICSG